MTLVFLGDEVVNVLLIDAPGENQSLSAEARSEGGSWRSGGDDVARFCVHILDEHKTKYCMEFSASGSRKQILKVRSYMFISAV